MSKKDFELIARVIKESSLDPLAKFVIATAFTAELRKTNPRFDGTRFLTACLPLEETAHLN